MATLTLQIGPVISVLTVTNNLKAADVIRKRVRLSGYEGDINDNQAVADFYMQQIKEWTTDGAREQERRDQVPNLVDAIWTDPDLIFED